MLATPCIVALHSQHAKKTVVILHTPPNIHTPGSISYGKRPASETDPAKGGLATRPHSPSSK